MAHINTHVTGSTSAATPALDTSFAPPSSEAVVSAPGTGTPPPATNSASRSRLMSQFVQNNEALVNLAGEEILAQNPPALRTLVEQAGLKHHIAVDTPSGRKSALDKLKSDPELAAKFKQLAELRLAYTDTRASLTKLRSDAEAKAKVNNPTLSGAALNTAVNGVLQQPDFKNRFDALKAKIAPWEGETNERADKLAKDGAEKTQYVNNVTGWLSNLKSLEQLNLQRYEKVMHKISILDIGPGDPYLRKESPPESIAHSNTLPRQGQEDLNGIVGNRGDINVFHAGMAINEAIGELMKKAAHDSGVDPETTIVKQALGKLAVALKLPVWQRSPNQLADAFKGFETLVDAIKHAVDTGKSKLPGVPVANLLEATSQLAEMRGGLGTTNAMRALIQSFQSGGYWFYRAKPDLGLPQGESAALVAKIFANDQLGDDGKPTRAPLKYSTAILGGSMLPGGQLRERTADGDRDAMHVAADPEKIPQEIDRTSEFLKLLKEPANAQVQRDWKALTTEQKKDEANWPDNIKLVAAEAQRRAEDGFAENAHYFNVRGKHRAGGDTCSTFLVRVNQTAKLQEAVMAEFEDFAARKRTETPGISGADIAKALIKEYGLPSGEEMNTPSKMPPKVQEICQRAMDANFKGLLDNKPEGVSPQSVEDNLRNSELYEFVGVLSIEADEVLNLEQNFDKRTGLPTSTRYPFEASGSSNPALHGATGNING